jgi:hypothetical protein
MVAAGSTRYTREEAAIQGARAKLANFTLAELSNAEVAIYDRPDFDAPAGYTYYRVILERRVFFGLILAKTILFESYCACEDYDDDALHAVVSYVQDILTAIKRA